ncbi:hypothetical protein I2I05_04335 [Hymenobacter sp. BT683]|uniref:Uncharacterized protein n=1 Tax=Hymenobacter jeongseonensis TaxID=2791027 RepID=A0ABS0IE48_9BACT|nr:hypothetical protein [Hymenobacter jeongseonensis]MBF9236617.1 hypothetical protein [Hymenobacter jeongseonensis]
MAETPNSEINDGKLLVLHQDSKGVVQVGHVAYSNPLENELELVRQLCDSEHTTLDRLKDHLARTRTFDQLVRAKEYRYCIELNAAYQSFQIKLDQGLSFIKLMHNIIKSKKKSTKPGEYYDPTDDVENCKKYIKELYTKWCKAYAIELAYESCKRNQNILAYSHRICGWSNPVHRLTPNFTVEVKTNFGYGGASYFFTKLTFKDVEIIPFSEWVQYAIARVTEIVRYSKCYELENRYWRNALLYCRDACNLSLTDEEQFISKYIIDECDIMVKELEEMVVSDELLVISRKEPHKGRFKLDKAGHYLVEYKGEKISGALDLITKILAFDKIASVSNFITRIEQANKKIQPILVNELLALVTKIQEANATMALLQPDFLAYLGKNKEYINEKQALRELLAQQQGVPSYKLEQDHVDIAFHDKFPEYRPFEKDFKAVSERYHQLTDHIKNLNRVLDSISNYKDRIDTYFCK